jgi:hypothetical protein
LVVFDVIMDQRCPGMTLSTEGRGGCCCEVKSVYLLVEWDSDSMLA